MSVVITLCVITDNCNFVSALEETILHTRSCKNGFDLNIWKLKMLGFFPPSQYPQEHQFHWKVPRLYPFVLMRAAAARWVWTLYGVILTGRNGVLGGNPVPKPVFFTTDLTGIGLGSNPGLRGDCRLLPSEDCTLWCLSLPGTPQRCARFIFPQQRSWVFRSGLRRFGGTNCLHQSGWLGSQRNRIRSIALFESPQASPACPSDDQDKHGTLMEW